MKHAVGGRRRNARLDLLSRVCAAIAPSQRQFESNRYKNLSDHKTQNLSSATVDS
jgi:hypothetical protein